MEVFVVYYSWMYSFLQLYSRACFVFSTFAWLVDQPSSIVRAFLSSPQSYREPLEFWDCINHFDLGDASWGSFYVLLAIMNTCWSPSQCWVPDQMQHLPHCLCLFTCTRHCLHHLAYGCILSLQLVSISDKFLSGDGLHGMRKKTLFTHNCVSNIELEIYGDYLERSCCLMTCSPSVVWEVGCSQMSRSFVF